MLKIKLKKLSDLAMTPTKGSEGAAGYDLYSLGGEMVEKGKTTLIKTGISMEIPKGFEGQVRPRSGLSLKGLVAQFGTIDSDYRGDIGVIMHNQGQWDRILEAGTRVAQIVIKPTTDVTFEEVDELDQTERGEDGFGSTG